MAGIGSRSAKLMLASAGLAAAAGLAGLAGPGVVRFLAAEVPRAYGSLVGWLRPPYLYLVINGIIISIAASSRFNKPNSAAAEAPDPAPVARSDFAPAPEVRAAELVEPVEEYGATLAMVAVNKAGETNEVKTKGEWEREEEEEEEEEFVISRSSWEPRRRETDIPALEFPVSTKEKPLVSTRFTHRRTVKPSPEGKALGVARQKRQETLESTWRTITDGRPVPLARHLKKSDTWESRPRDAAEAPYIRKSETFNEQRRAAAVSAPEASPGSGGGGGPSRLRRDPSVGQDELNRRVEAFINKFNEEMRLQRQESFQHYLDMINRGAH